MIEEERVLFRYFPTEEEIPENFRIHKPLDQKAILINGEIIQWEGSTNPVFSPILLRNNQDELIPIRIGSYPLGTEVEAALALKAAENAYNLGRGEWPTMTVIDRIHHVEEFTFRMLERKKEVVQLILWEIGKSWEDSEKEFDRTVEYIYATIEALKKSDNNSSKFEIVDGIAGQIRRSPLGVVLCMGPFNYPLNETFTTLIPALIMGNTVLFKPPKHGTLLFAPLLEAFRDSFPKGVVNTIYGRGGNVVPGLMASGKVDVLALIGSSKVADQLIKLHPKTNRLRSILSLDAKNQAIILDDAELENTVKECVLGALSFNGQRCTAIKIIFVHSSIAEIFLEKLCLAVNNLTIGMPWKKGVKITPVPEPNKPNYIQEVLAEAQTYGAKIVNIDGGITVGTLIKPAVVYPVDQRMKLYREEQFGPVIPIVPFSSIQEPIDYLINSDHGQQVSIFGADSEKIAQLIDPLVNLVCRVNINSQCQRGPDVFPFTGRKDSADGTLSVSDALRAFSIRSMVATKLTLENKTILNKMMHENESKFLNTRFIF